MADITPATTPHPDHKPVDGTTLSSAPAAAPAHLADDDGTTVIQENVIAKIAGIAARGVAGVYDLGGGAARAFGVIRDATNNTDLTQGVKVEVNDSTVRANVTVVVSYPSRIHEVASDVRKSVIDAITELAGMDVVEVNVTVTDVHVPSDDDEATATDAVTAKVDDAKASASAKLDDAKEAVSEKLDDAKSVVSGDDA